ncbi:hypothetical protein [Microvirga mediterraneensis]|uniref:Uncharacterized protein n=1 Tax=Microvirga mediterraneensis TaxID=2754695 RepID=A0A838BUZ9_9HYPH|nr:hypothetical protein [Microvirga mediterraneensis]MBA1159367.1 hypothetical protein [Microvirga mediterraneensis]
MADPTLTDLLAEAREELQWRRWVYPRRVMDGVMKLSEQTRKIALQEAIVENLQRQVEAEIGTHAARKVQPLFAGRAH